MKLTMAKIMIVTGVLAVLTFAGGSYLVANFNMSTHYASEFPTATQTEKVCHGPNCRYLAPDIAFRLKAGLALATGSTIVLALLSILYRMSKE